jgi:hypothetical protein
MEDFYKLGPVTLCIRNWPRDFRWPFAFWKLDAYRTQKAEADITAEYDPEFSLQETDEWRFVESAVTAKRMEQSLPNGWRLWKQVQSSGEELKFAVSSRERRIVLMKDETDTCGVAAVEALTFFVFPLLLEKNILSIHSALLEYNGEGVLIAAPSGVGKTTHARLWRDTKNALILNGDRAACYQKDGKWLAFGTPWCGTSGENINRQVPVKALVLLRRGEHNEVVPMQPMAVLSQLLPLITCPLLPGEQGKMLELLDGFLKAVPVVGLACTPDASAVETLWAYLENL